jgi:hypothetical protein
MGFQVKPAFVNILSHESQLFELENNPFDVISIVNNSVGQANQSPININPICDIKYVSDLGGGWRLPKETIL